MEAQKAAELFKAISDENRIRILQLLSAGEKCACKLLAGMDVTQPTLSHHMKILCDSGIVVGRKEGKWMYYSVSQQGIGYARQCFEELIYTSTNENEKPGRIIPKEGTRGDKNE